MNTPAFSEDRYFSPDPATRAIARELYESVRYLPIYSLHGHVNPRLLSDPDASFGNPAELFIIPDHYLFRMLYSQGIPLEKLGIPRRDGGPVEQDPRKIWKLFAENYHLFRGTPTGAWLNFELCEVFGVRSKLCAENALEIYQEIDAKLKTPAFRPRALFERFNISVLATTDAATDTLDDHRCIRKSGWKGVVIPTFRPDAVMKVASPRWQADIRRLGELTRITIDSYPSFIKALQERRAFFKSMGAVATDTAVQDARTEELSPAEAGRLFDRALENKATNQDEQRFSSHMVSQMAAMSVDDGLAMQLHAGVWRDHNDAIAAGFGPDKGCDIPVPVDFVGGLRPLLNKFGNDSRLRLIVFTMDETTYARELAPLAGHYPAMKLGASWWFHDSINGMKRFRDQVMETAGLHNTTGFVDDTRAFLSIPARHDLARRVDADWIAGLVARHVIDMNDAREMICDCAVGLAKKAYNIG